MEKKLQWKVFEPKDFSKITKPLLNSPWYGSDTCVANLFFLQKKYDIKMCVYAGFLFRFYSGTDKNRYGYGFPLKIQDGADLKTAIQLIIDDALSFARPANLCLITETQKQELENCLTQNFSEYKINFESERNDSDYVYSRLSLAELKGKTYHKKKNHVLRFQRIHEGEWTYKSLDDEVAEDIIKVSCQWMKENGNEDLEVLRMEHESIESSLNARNIFDLTGGVLYIGKKPVAMTVASPINNKVIDVHFEKCLTQYATDGGYAAINWCFANSCTQYDFLNREEDMGVEGLRKAKLSYHPDIILNKWFGEIKKC